jgi:hypothetical protein
MDRYLIGALMGYFASAVVWAHITEGLLGGNAPLYLMGLSLLMVVWPAFAIWVRESPAT